jgi:hypothetical protein
VSLVGRSNNTLNDFMRQQCALVAEYGGSFSVRDVLNNVSWFTEYTIHWPQPIVTTELAA